eukprot:4640655-Prymnesium_polylepis.1
MFWPQILTASDLAPQRLRRSRGGAHEGRAGWRGGNARRLRQISAVATCSLAQDAAESAESWLSTVRHRLFRPEPLLVALREAVVAVDGHVVRLFRGLGACFEAALVAVAAAAALSGSRICRRRRGDRLRDLRLRQRSVQLHLRRTGFVVLFSERHVVPIVRILQGIDRVVELVLLVHLPAQIGEGDRAVILGKLLPQKLQAQCIVIPCAALAAAKAARVAPRRL